MASLFHSKLETPLIDLGGHPWCIRDAAEASLIVGAPGSGKSSASGRMISRAALRAGMGFLVLCAKVDEADTWRRYIAEAGRLDDLIVIDETAQQRFNILDFAAERLGGEGFELNIVEIMRRMVEAARVAGDKAATDGGENSYFVDGAMKWCSHAFPLLMLTGGTIRLQDLNRLITTYPQTEAETKSPEWHKTFCAQVHIRANELTKTGDRQNYARRVLNDHGVFFLQEVPRLDNRPRSSIESTLTNMINPFLSGRLADLFCTTTTVTPDATRDGKIILMDLPTLKYGAAGAVAQAIFKYLFGIAMQSEKVTEATRPVMIYLDEAQNFLSSSDADLLAMSRSSKICPVFISQDFPTFAAKIGEEPAKSLLGKFGTRIYHANLSHETNVAAAEACGKGQKFYVSENIGQTMGGGGGGNQHDMGGGFQAQSNRARSRGKSLNGYQDYHVPPDYFAGQLRTGGPSNRMKVDGIVVRTGRKFQQTGSHWVQVEFDQR